MQTYIHGRSLQVCAGWLKAKAWQEKKICNVTINQFNSRQTALTERATVHNLPCRQQQSAGWSSICVHLLSGSPDMVNNNDNKTKHSVQINKKDLSCHCSAFPQQNVVGAVQPESRKTPVTSWQSRRKLSAEQLLCYSRSQLSSWQIILIN